SATAPMSLSTVPAIPHIWYPFPRRLKFSATHNQHQTKPPAQEAMEAIGHGHGENPPGETDAGPFQNFEPIEHSFHFHPCIRSPDRVFRAVIEPYEFFGVLRVQHVF